MKTKLFTKLFFTLTLACTLAVAPVQISKAAPATQPTPLTLAFTGFPTLNAESRDNIELPPQFTFDPVTATYTLIMYKGRVINIPIANTIPEYSIVVLEDVPHLSAWVEEEGFLKVSCSEYLEDNQVVAYPVHLQLMDLRVNSPTLFQTYGNIINFNVVVCNPYNAELKKPGYHDAQAIEFTRLLNEHRQSIGLKPVEMSAEAIEFAKIRIHDPAFFERKEWDKDGFEYHTLFANDESAITIWHKFKNTSGHYSWVTEENINEFGVTFYTTENGVSKVAVVLTLADT